MVILTLAVARVERDGIEGELWRGRFWYEGLTGDWMRVAERVREALPDSDRGEFGGRVMAREGLSVVSGLTTGGAERSAKGSLSRRLVSSTVAEADETESISIFEDRRSS